MRIHLYIKWKMMSAEDSKIIYIEVVNAVY